MEPKWPKTETLLDLLREEDKAMTKIDLFRSLGHFSWLANQSANNRLELMVTKNSYQFGISKFVCVVYLFSEEKNSEEVLE